MAKDWIVIRIIFSGALIVFGIAHMLYTIFSRIRNKIRLNKDLRDIKNYDIQKIVQESLQDVQSTGGNENTKKEMENLLKNIYFNLYNQHKDSKEIQKSYADIETSIDHVLDNNILNIIEEKEKLLQEKDQVIQVLEEKNDKFINDTIAKISYIVEEKDKLLQEKDMIIVALYKRLQSGKIVHHTKPNVVPSEVKTVTAPQAPKTPAQTKQHTGPKYYYSEYFVNVNKS